jgi:hypothetical protein
MNRPQVDHFLSGVLAYFPSGARTVVKTPKQWLRPETDAHASIAGDRAHTDGLDSRVTRQQRTKVADPEAHHSSEADGMKAPRPHPTPERGATNLQRGASLFLSDESFSLCRKSQG